MPKARFPNMGMRLKVLREAAGITQQELAVRAGLSVGFVSQMEQGVKSKTDPKLSTLVALAEALGMPVGKLAEELSAKEPGPAPSRKPPKRPRGRPRKKGGSE